MKRIQKTQDNSYHKGADQGRGSRFKKCKN